MVRIQGCQKRKNQPSADLTIVFNGIGEKSGFIFIVINNITKIAFQKEQARFGPSTNFLKNSSGKNWIFQLATFQPKTIPHHFGRHAADGAVLK